jgi:hypothetical protein
MQVAILALGTFSNVDNLWSSHEMETFQIEHTGAEVAVDASRSCLDLILERPNYSFLKSALIENE